MSSNLTLTLLIPWLFWGVLAGLLAYAGRSWISMLFIPFLTSLLLVLISQVASVEKAFWFSVVVHLSLLVYFAISYTRFVITQRGK